MTRTPDSHLSLPRLFADHPAEGDGLYFEFDGLAKTLAQLALNPDNSTPFTVVVRGGWGRGKTTLLKRAKHLMEHPAEATEAKGLRKVEALWFNAWKYPDEDTVLAGLLGQLLDKFRQGDLRKPLKVLADGYEYSLFGKVLHLAAPAELKGLVSGKGFEDRFSEAEKRRAFHDTFRRLFIEVSALLFEGTHALRDTDHQAEGSLWTSESQHKHTVAVFLDDLDRCRGERVREVLEAVNLFLDLPGVCFFLFSWGWTGPAWWPTCRRRCAPRGTTTWRRSFRWPWSSRR